MTRALDLFNTGQICRSLSSAMKELIENKDVRRRSSLPLSSPCLKPGASRSFFGEELRAYIQNTAASQSTATHAMLSVPINVEQIEQIAAREDWLVQRTSFGFDFMMLWVENRLLIELLTPEMTAQYMAFTQRENLRNYFVFPDSPDAPKS